LVDEIDLKLLYTTLLTLSIPLLILRLIWRGFRAPAYWQRWPERFGSSQKLSNSPAIIWIHAVSFGEVEASRPVINALQSEYPNHQLLITTMTPTGSARVKSLFADSVKHCYLPYDIPFAVKRFLKNTHPKFGIIMETEIWPNLLASCANQSIPLFLANARMSARSEKGYARFADLTKSTLQHLTLIAAQSNDDKQRLVNLGAPKKSVHVIGNLKYEITLPTSLAEQALSMRTLWDINRPVLIAASTHEGEEEMILNASRQVRSKYPNLLLILVPRHPERFDRVAAIAQKSGHKVLRRSQKKPCPAEIQVLLVDTMGELPLFYAASDVAFVGGSLVAHGGHNLLEPAILGRAILTGPHYFNFNEITKQFLTAKAALQVNNPAELATSTIMLLKSEQQRTDMGEQALKLMVNSQGASKRLINLIKYNLSHHEN
jgi:3-deoxy-D-manno-octulosonic-acid transferase